MADRTGDRSIVLAGVGGDSHSVGLIILNRGLVRAGYRVRYLGSQCPLPDVCRAARGADAVLVSNMDGHARYYLADLPSLREELGGGGALWYLGGNPSLSSEPEDEDRLRSLGFDRVFLGFVEQRTVLSLLADDLVNRPPAVPVPPREDAGRPRGVPGPVAAARPLEEERDDVLLQWSSGAQARDMAANAEVLRERAWLATRQRAAVDEGTMLIQPRTGVFDDEGQRRLFAAMRAAGADTLSLQIDSLTRNGAYEDIELLRKGGGPAQGAPVPLNGYPAVNRGVAALRRLTHEFRETPIQVRHSARDPRLLAEVSFAGGVSGYEGGPITYNLPYYRDYRPVHAVASWRYVDQLAGAYHKHHGIVIDREFFGVLTASLVPPSLAAAVNVLEALLAASHGVKSVSLGYAEQGNRAQDIAAIRAMRTLGRQYLDRFGFTDVAVYTVFHQYMGAFPVAAHKARQLLEGSARTARLSGADRLMVKSHVEAVRIPSQQENVDSIALVRRAAALPPGPLPEETAFEEHLVLREARALLDAALRLGEGSFERAAVRAIDAGIVDVPFSPSRWNAGKVLSVRDLNGAVRFADFGSLPLPADVRAAHRDRVRRRLRAQPLPVEQIVEQDILFVSRGGFGAWPLDNLRGWPGEPV